ncbi:MAG: rod shape-determining protein MreC [Candidatus Zambryskibacteria bacterium]|nr:rod shape-determining protein MreC [Candidatus Zambryskibacteria bacterium]
MSFLLKNKPKSNVKKVVGISVLVCFFLLSLKFFFPRFLLSASLALASPVWKVRDMTQSTFSGFFGYFRRVSTLQSENEQLRLQLEILHIKEAGFDQIKTEYEDLKGLLNATSTPEVLLARVLSKPPFTPYDSLVLDKGSAKGVKVGDTVYANQALVLGRISQVTSGFSYATLFSSGGESGEFTISRTGVSVSVLGIGGGNFEISLPKDFDIVVGDTLLYPAYDEGIVAKVYAVDETSQNSFKKVYARIPGSLFKIKSVLIGQM